MLLMIGGTFFSAVSQILLKQSADKTYRHPILEYLNPRVILAYFFFFGVLLLNTYAYTKVDMKYGPVLDTFVYVFVLFLSYCILKEKISKGKLIGNFIIIAGIILYTL
jgi:drug/metabolite transporter (DMT)-like permease